MEELDDEQRLIRQYLMGEPGPERERVEERMLADPDFFERVLMVEEGLFEDFVYGGLSAPEREGFKEHLLASPLQVNKLEIAKALKNYPAVERKPGAWWVGSFTTEQKLGAALAFAVLLLLGSFAGYMMLSREPLEKELARLNSQPAVSGRPDQSVYTETLTSTRFRGPGAGDEEKRLTIPPGTEVVLLQLALEGDPSESYGLTLMRNGERRPPSVNGLKPASADGANVLPVRIPARALTPGYYELTLTGFAADGSPDGSIDSYTFRVVDDER